jgi:hypothetical protein
MLTIFTVPKPFQGHIGLIQRNAIKSWTHLEPRCEIILCGDEPGTAEVASEFKAKFLPNIAHNEYGTPLLNAVFDQVQQSANQPLLCYVNTDIILLSDFLNAVERIRFRKFVMLGQRWDVDLAHSWNFDRADWEHRLQRYVINHGELHPPGGIDYFVFPRVEAMGKMPQFAVGRPKWDNWFIYNARMSDFRVVDATKVAMVIHQNHDYNHVPQKTGKKWEGPEADQNQALLGGQKYQFNLFHATHLLTSWALIPALGYKHLMARWWTLPVLSPRATPFVRLIDKWIVSILRRLIQPFRRQMISK